MLKVILYYFLSTLSVLGDSIFLYYLNLHLLQSGSGGMLCSIVWGMDAILEIVVGPFFARFIDAIPDISVRLRRSLIIQVGLMGVALLPALSVTFTHNYIILLLLTFALMRFFLLVDTQLRASLPLCLDKQKNISLVRSLSLSTLSVRGVFLISASLSPILLSSTWLFVCTMNSLSYIFAFFALLTILKIISKPSFKIQEAKKEKGPLDDNNKEKRGWIQWNCLSFLLAYFAFGGMTLILTKSMLMAEGSSFFYQALRGPAPFYGGVLVALGLMVIYHKKSESFSKNVGKLCGQMLILGIGLVITAFSTPGIQIALLFVIGIINGFSIVSSETFLQRKVEGKDFVKAWAKSQAFGRIGFLFSLGSVGLGIDFGLNCNELLAIAGVIAVIISTVLFITALPLERKSRTATNPVFAEKS